MSNRATTLVTELLSDTLHLIPNGIEASASGIASLTRDRVSKTAINNRLEKLRKLGLVSRRKVGRQWCYRKTGKPLAECR